jgi:hypothetical protein
LLKIAHAELDAAHAAHLGVRHFDSSDQTWSGA